MPKKFVSDITPPKRTVWDIPVPAHRRHLERAEHVEHADSPPPPPGEMKARHRNPFRKRYILVASIVGLIVLVLLGRELLKVRATVTVVEKKNPVSIDGTFIGKKDAKESELPFDVISSTRESSVVVPATGEKKVETRAQGSIVVYNDYSSASQRLIKNTRFETPDGRIYRIDQSITVPGRNNNTGVPGSVETVVYADAVGESYNIGLSDFTIPGFKGDPRYAKFFARSKTPMSGGFIGMVKTASASDLKKAKDDLRVALKSGAIKELETKVPGDLILFSGATYSEFETLSPPESNELKERITVYGIVFDRKKLSGVIASAALADYDNAAVIGENLEKIVFTPVPIDARPWQTGIVSFSLRGSTIITWIFDEDKLKEDLAGQPKDRERITTILQAYPSVDQAEVVVRPFWRRTLPDSVDEIVIKVADTIP